MTKNIMPHVIGKKQLRRIIERLQEARRASTMERMSVDNFGTGKTLATFEDGSPVLDNEVSDFIRERTRLYRETWVTSPLEDIIEELVASIYGSGTGRVI